MRALVIGGTGPSGPHLVNGLLARGYDVTVLHRGNHEVEFDRQIGHIHSDPFDLASLQDALAGRKFDVTYATYGKVTSICDAVRGRTTQLIASSGTVVYAPPGDTRWGPLGRPVALREDHPVQDDEVGHGFGHAVWRGEQRVLKGHAAGEFSATILRMPMIYGPRALADVDWSIVRRIRDGRRRFPVAYGGMTVTRRGFGENVGHALLLCVDNPEAAAGQVFNVADTSQPAQRQRIECFASMLGSELELIELPAHVAAAVSPLWTEAAHRAMDTTKLRERLGYVDRVPPAEAIEQSVRWFEANPPSVGGMFEKQLGDRFDYELEDRLFEICRESERRCVELAGDPLPATYAYTDSTGSSEER